MKKSILCIAAATLVATPLFACEVFNMSQLNDMETPVLQRLLKNYKQEDSSICLNESVKIEQIIKGRNRDNYKNIREKSIEAVEKKALQKKENDKIYRRIDKDGTFIFSDNPNR